MEQNSRNGVALLREAANGGSVWGMQYLGEMLDNEDGVEEGAKESFRWYWKAAHRSDGATAKVGICLIRGIGVERNVRAGVRYMLDTGAAGYTLVFERLARYYRRGIGVGMNKKICSKR